MAEPVSESDQIELTDSTTDLGREILGQVRESIEEAVRCPDSEEGGRIAAEAFTLARGNRREIAAGDVVELRRHMRDRLDQSKYAAFNRALSPAPPASGNETTFRWYAPSELPKGSPDNDLVRDFIAPGEVACLAGLSGSCKSFLALDLAVAVAGGRETFLGARVQRHGLVLYMAGEGFGGLRARVLAADPEGRASARLRFAAEVPTLLEPDSVRRTLAAARELIAQRGFEAPLLVIIDTFATAVAGADENDNGAMGAAAKAAGSFAQELGAAVLLVHHAKKNRQAGESFLRGASSLLCALDAAWGIERISGQELACTITCEKQKDRESGGAWRVEFELVEAGERATLRVANVTRISAPGSDGIRASKKATTAKLRRDMILVDLLAFPDGLAPAELQQRVIGRGLAMSGRTRTDDMQLLTEAGLLDPQGHSQNRRILLTIKGRAAAQRVLNEGNLAWEGEKMAVGA